MFFFIEWEENGKVRWHNTNLQSDGSNDMTQSGLVEVALWSLVFEYDDRWITWKDVKRGELKTH